MTHPNLRRLGRQAMRALAAACALLAAAGCEREPAAVPAAAHAAAVASSGASNAPGASNALGASNSPGRPAAAAPRVALVMKTLTNPFFVEMERGARRAEQELGIELLVRTAAQETSIEQQIGIVDELVRDRVDAIVLAPGDSAALVPAVRRARDAGIAVVNIDNRLDASLVAAAGLAEVPFVSVDNEKAAFAAAARLAHGLPAGAEVALIEGIRGAANAEARRRGALAAFAARGGLQVVASESANWKIDEAHDAAARILARHPRVQAIFCANDMMALGALQHLRQAGRAAQVRVAGYDALEQARQAVADGALAVTVDQRAAEQGHLGVQQAVRALRGEPLPAVTLLDARLVTPER